MISQQHFRIGHGHDFSQDSNAARMPINHIPQNVKDVLILQIDLLQYGLESAFIAVNIGKHIYHWGSHPFLYFPDYKAPRLEQSRGSGNVIGVYPSDIIKTHLFLCHISRFLGFAIFQNSRIVY